MANNKISKDQIVWARMRGFPWWPGVVKIIQVSELLYSEDESSSDQLPEEVVVNFIGENTQ